MKEQARRTLELIEKGAYATESGATVDFAKAQRLCEESVRLYTPGELDVLRTTSTPGPRPTIEVVSATTQRAALDLIRDGANDLVLLNFASARNPGGGFLNNAKAQEEDLCRCSGLYPTLVTQMAYYEANRKTESLLYTDHAIYTPRVPFFRLRGSGALLDEVFIASVITMPAPNSGPTLRRDPDAGEAIRATFVRRWGNVLAIARAHEHRHVLLGAWGCGAFGGDADVASASFLTALGSWDFSAAFERIVFAIPATGKLSKANHHAFAACLTEEEPEST